MLKDYEDNLVAEMFSPQLRSSISGITTTCTLQKANSITFSSYMDQKTERLRNIGYWLNEDINDVRIYSDNVGSTTFTLNYSENNYKNTNTSNSMTISTDTVNTWFTLTANQNYGRSGTILLKVINFNSLKNGTQAVYGNFFTLIKNNLVNPYPISYDYTGLDTSKFATFYLTWNWNTSSKNYDIKSGIIGYRDSGTDFTNPIINVSAVSGSYNNIMDRLKEALPSNFDPDSRDRDNYPWFYFDIGFKDITTLQFTINSFRMYSVILDDAAIKEYAMGTPYINKSDKTFVAPNFTEKYSSSVKGILKDKTVNAPGGFEESSSGNVGIYKNGSIKAYSIFEK